MTLNKTLQLKLFLSAIVFLLILPSCRENDKTPPEIILKGSADTTINKFTLFEEPGYKAIDNVDGDITPFVSVQGQVDESLEKIYTIRYKVSDKAGNFTLKTRTVTVE